MHTWLGVALVAYLLGASIEGAFMVKQLFYDVPTLTKAMEEFLEPAEPPKDNWKVLVIFIAVIMGGAMSWPCRLLHRAVKEEHRPSD